MAKQEDVDLIRRVASVYRIGTETRTELDALATRLESERSEDEVIGDVLYGIWQLDNKPHQLFSALARFVERFSEPEKKAELHKLLEVAYENARYLLECDEPIDRALKFRNGLFKIANDYALKGEGEVAIYLHQSCNHILHAAARLKPEGEERRKALRGLFFPGA